VLLFDRLDPDCLEELLGLEQGLCAGYFVGCTRSPLIRMPDGPIRLMHPSSMTSSSTMNER